MIGIANANCPLDNHHKSWAFTVQVEKKRVSTNLEKFELLVARAPADFQEVRVKPDTPD